ncbi:MULTISPECIES: RHE_PE00001 family protein [unclassified Sinorhizobium]|uniref:RHE_PE00001 family protein n=1 Tax=unclassified Sinorhizobium TaxID=2613772 RepID=UPI0035260913
MRHGEGGLPLETLLPDIVTAEDRLARLDERVNRSDVKEGFRERSHFFDAAAVLWVMGELVHVEDIVLHDAHMDIRTPSHELTIAHAVLRMRRRLWSADTDWAFTAGLAAIRGQGHEHDGIEHAVRETKLSFAQEAEADIEAPDEPLAAELAEIDALLARSQRLLDDHGKGMIGREPASKRPQGEAKDATSTQTDPLGLLHDEDWDEGERFSEWRSVLFEADQLPPTMGAVVLYDAWSRIEPLRRQHWLGGLLASAYLRHRGKVSSHLFCFDTGLKAIRHERRRSTDRSTRLAAFLEAMTLSAEAGLKELDRLALARIQMERRLKDRRSSSSLPALIEFVLSRPMVSAAMIAKHIGVTPRGALNLIGELGIREMTGRGRYRAWGIL